MKFEQTQLALREAQNTRNELKRQLTVAESERSATRVSGEISPIDARILALQTKLDELLLRFTDLHPDVVEIREKIATLKKQKNKSKRTNYAASDSQTEGMTLVGQLRLALGKAEAELAGIRVRGSNYQQKVLQLSELVKTLPQIETKLKRLQRDYDINKQNYDLLVSRKESARMSESADAVGDDVKFKIIDPPRLPILPVSPNRPLFSVAILFLSLGAGAGLAIVLSQIHPVIYDQTRLRAISGLPVFGSVSRIWTPELIFKRKLEVGALMAAGLMLLLLFAVVILLHKMGGSGEIINAIRSAV
jgi:polysaccharide chain length determinant protein (PEP-CTERM system associated)